MDRFLAPFRLLPSLISQIPGYFRSVCSALYVSILSSSAVTILIEELDDVREYPGYKYLWFFYLPVYLAFRPVVVLIESLTKIIDTHKIRKPGASHVPTFYAPQSHYDDPGLFISFVLPLVATIFGGLHLIAWHFQFPSHIEQLLWRIGALTITVIPVASLALVFSVILFLLGADFLETRFGVPATDFNIPSSIEVILAILGAFVTVIGLIGYMLARLLLLTEAVVLLRKQPESAFYAIDWTHFLPHL